MASIATIPHQATAGPASVPPPSPIGSRLTWECPVRSTPLSFSSSTMAKASSPLAASNCSIGTARPGSKSPDRIATRKPRPVAVPIRSRFQKQRCSACASSFIARKRQPAPGSLSSKPGDREQLHTKRRRPLRATFPPTPAGRNSPRHRPPSTTDTVGFRSRPSMAGSSSVRTR